MCIAFLSPSLLRLATDNHIGYMERDPVRGGDSLEAFKEILTIAKEKEVSAEMLPVSLPLLRLGTTTYCSSLMRNIEHMHAVFRTLMHMYI